MDVTQMSDEETSELIQLQRTTIGLLEKLLADYKASYRAEKNRADSLQALIVDLDLIPEEGSETFRASPEEIIRALRSYGVI